MGKRIDYLDTAKFIGIFCIYLGHFAAAAGHAYAFVFTFHVALFFFLSGCTESLGREVPFLDYVKKQAKNILAPFFFFAVVSLAFHCVYADSSLDIVPSLEVIAQGAIRNRFLNGTLWFFTCLFSTKVLFYALRKLLKNKALILLACLGLYVCSMVVCAPGPIDNPHVIYNIDSACYYIAFYGLGYCCFDPIRRLFEFDRPYKLACFGVIGLASFVYAALLFFGNDVLDRFNVNLATDLVVSVVGPCIVFVLVLVVSRLLQDVELFKDLGKNTLYLCGSEYFIKILVPLCLEAVGLNLTLPNPVAAYLYTFVLLVLCNKTLVPLEKAALKKMRLLK